jgi:uncharacterized protein YdhG (YjbR/CyaY superfamily)
MSDVERYINNFEPEIKERLILLRQLFFDFNQNITESIRYNMPSFKVGNHFLYFAAYKKHIGFYPVYGIPEIEEELTQYRAKGTKDTLHFLHHKPLPIMLIKQIINCKAKN